MRRMMSQKQIDYIENIEGAATLGLETFHYTGDDEALLNFFKDRI